MDKQRKDRQKRHVQEGAMRERERKKTQCSSLVGKIEGKQLFTSQRIDCHYDYQLQGAATPWWQVWDWKYDWLILQDETKYCAFQETKVNFVEDGELIEVSLHSRFEWRLGQMRITVPLSLTPLLCINLCLEVTDSENSIRSVSSHQYLSHSLA